MDKVRLNLTMSHLCVFGDQCHVRKCLSHQAPSNWDAAFHSVFQIYHQLVFIIPSVNVISFTSFALMLPGISALHVSWRCAVTVVVLDRSTEKMLDSIRSKKNIYFGFIWPSNVQPMFIRTRSCFCQFNLVVLYIFCAAFSSAISADWNHFCNCDSACVQWCCCAVSLFMESHDLV